MAHDFQCRHGGDYMNDRPHAAELLNAAREAVTTEILPALPEALRYTGLMVVNAIAIAEREVAARDTTARAECERLQILLSERSESLAGDALAGALARYNRAWLTTSGPGGLAAGTRRAAGTAPDDRRSSRFNRALQDITDSVIQL
jgi:hypothetical protein